MTGKDGYEFRVSGLPLGLRWLRGGTRFQPEHLELQYLVGEQRVFNWNNASHLWGSGQKAVEQLLEQWEYRMLPWALHA